MIRRKTSMTSFDIAAVVARLKSLTPFRLVNIYGVDNAFILKVRGQSIEGNIVAEPGVRLHITRYDIVEKGVPPPLIMGFRKYARGRVVTDIWQHGFDRIVFARLADGHKLVFEIIPRGVIALLDPNDIVVHVTEQKQMKDRIIARNKRYTPPPQQTIPPTSLEEQHVTRALAGGRELARVLARGLGYPGEVVEEALYRIGFKPDMKPEDMGPSDVQAFIDAVRAIYEESLSSQKGYILHDPESGPLTITPFEPRGLREAYGFETRVIDDLMQAFDEYFTAMSRSVKASGLLARLQEERKRIERAIEKTIESIRANEEKLERLKRVAEVVSQYINEVYEAHECVNRLREQYGWEYIVGNCKGVVDVDPSQGVYRLSIGGELVEFHVSRDPYSQVVEMYRRIGELESKIRRARTVLSELERKREEIQKTIVAETRKAASMVRKREWYEKYHWLFTSNWYLAIGGRDASQNESVVKRYLRDNDIFIHADIHGGSAVVLLVDHGEPSEEDIREAAVLAACYSKAWKAGVGAVDVYWARGSQVSKSPPAGEYLARGAFMVYGKRNYIHGVELRLAIGVSITSEGPVVIVGPEHIVRRRSHYYAVIVPGDTDPSKTAQKLRSIYRKMASEEHRAYIDAVTIDEIRARIPGSSRIIATRKGEGVEPPRPSR